MRDGLVRSRISVVLLNNEMSRLFGSSRSGRLQFTTPTPALRRDISILVFDGVRFEYKGKQFNPGCLAIMLPTEQMKSRANAEEAIVLVGRHVCCRGLSLQT